MKTVPEDPTETMLFAGNREWPAGAERVYRAMLAAAPPCAGEAESLLATVSRDLASMTDEKIKAEAEFKNFHRMLCERFGYTHDELDWKRDQVSLMEHIGRRPTASDIDAAARRIATDHYTRGGKPEDHPDVVVAVEANWYAWRPEARAALERG